MEKYNRSKFIKMQLLYQLIGTIFIIIAIIVKLNMEDSFLWIILGVIGIFLFTVGIGAGRGKKCCCKQCGYKCHTSDIISSMNNTQVSTKKFKCPKCQNVFSATLSNNYDIDFDLK